jgi:membrane protease YdiL (CAAX protease family)
MSKRIHFVTYPPLREKATMSTPSTIHERPSSSGLRLLVARHPYAAFLIMAFTITTLFTLPPVRNRLGVLVMDFTLWDSFATIFGVALPAFIVMAALHGREGVRDLARRSFRWRVGIQWYLVALLALPTAVFLTSSVMYGRAPGTAVVDQWPRLFTLILPDLLLRIVLLNLAEEIGWTGFFQSRLQDGFGPIKAVVLTEIPFALWHVPFELADAGGEILSAIVTLGVFSIFQLCARVIIMWLYNNTNSSVLLVGLFHAAHNTTVNRVTAEFIPASAVTGFLITESIVLVAALLLLLFTRGRLSYKPASRPT